jgi:hypothetical protein
MLPKHTARSWTPPHQLETHKADHDPALTYSQRNTFVVRARTLFIDGRVLDEPDPDEVGTCLDIVLKEARAAKPIVFDGGRVVNLWRKPTQEMCEKLVGGITAITKAMIERIEVS